MKTIDRLAIVGVGLLGGSLGMAMRQQGLAREVVGVGRTQRNLDEAIARGCIDRASRRIEDVAGADVVVLATPVARLAQSAREAAPHLRPGAIVTDVGSSKATVVRDCVTALGPSARFVGSHPIAGMERSGAAAARPDLFAGARCVVTPVADTDPEACRRVVSLWQSIGMDVQEMDPAEHDRVLALTSHLPHVVAWALARSVQERPGALELSGPSLRDMTRIAGASIEMWKDILLTNADAVGAEIAVFRDRLDALASAVEEGDADALDQQLGEALAVREAIRRTQGEVIEPARAPLRGSVRVPGDKSIGHRALILGALAEGRTEIVGLSDGEDNASTLSVLRSLGVQIEREGGEVRIEGRGAGGLRAPEGELDCGNSGSTLRMMCGVLAGLPFETTLAGDASLRKRPMERVAGPLRELGAEIETTAGLPPVRIRGHALRAGRVELSVSSAQIKTAVLLAGLGAEGRTTVVEPARSRDHTERLLPAFGVEVDEGEGGALTVLGPAQLTAARVEIPADPSAAAFWLVAGSIVPGSRLELERVSMNPTRTGAFDVLRAMGARIDVRPRPPIGAEPVVDLVVEAAPLRGVDVDGELMLRSIDEFPVLAVAAALAGGRSRFRDGAELRLKETDRIAAMAEALSRLGATVHEESDGLIIEGGGGLRGGSVDARGDHRIAMALAVAALVARHPVRVRDARSMAVSDPGFLRQLAGLRGDAP